jgi:hypothetical protein
MGGLHCDGDEDAGDEAREVARCRRSIRRDRGRGSMVAASCLGVPSVPKCSDPRGEAAEAKNAEIGTGGEFGTQYSGAQLLVAIRGVRRRDDQAGLSRFFLRASARSRLRLCTLTPKRASIASRHCEVVISGFGAL